MIGKIGRPEGDGMLQVLFSGATRELELSGTRRALLALGQLLREKAGSCDLSENRHPFPYERSLSEFAFQEEPERDTASILAEDRILRIRAGREALDLLADAIEGFASEADASHHRHVDFPTYDYIAPESDPLVIAFMG
ncbi:Imm32 family immunity protein [Streptomyces melanogenes]|uniref:Imm32 family immunity protein n=1 Tax=Streptomyces melanogenes TaxID=67326 RepID=UPI003792916C